MATKMGRPSKQSIAMKKSWERRKAIAAAKAMTAIPADNKRMRIRVLSQQDGIQLDNYILGIDKFGELMDILHTKYMGIAISEILIQIE